MSNNVKECHHGSFMISCKLYSRPTKLSVCCTKVPSRAPPFRCMLMSAQIASRPLLFVMREPLFLNQWHETSHRMQKESERDRFSQIMLTLAQSFSSLIFIAFHDFWGKKRDSIPREAVKQQQRDGVQSKAK